MPARKKAVSTADTAPVQPTRQTESPLVFISHDSRDADLAEAFSNLLTDASGGILKSFRSSDKKGTAGIEYGVEWYRAIMKKLDDATDVVALLTARSIDRGVTPSAQLNFLCNQQILTDFPNVRSSSCHDHVA